MKEIPKDEVVVEEKVVNDESTNENTAVTETAVEVEEEKEEEDNRFMLLDYLFRFVETRQTPLNPVLSGYFSKLLILLLNRKQKQIVPYIFSDNCTVLENLLYHTY